MNSETVRDWIKVGGVIIVTLMTIAGFLLGSFATKSDITRLEEAMRKGFEIVNLKLETMDAKFDSAQVDRSLIREDIQRVEK